MMDNISKIMVKTFAPLEMAEICNTNVEEIIDMIGKNVFRELQQRAKNQRDIIGTKEEIKEIYQQKKDRI